VFVANNHDGAAERHADRLWLAAQQLVLRGHLRIGVLGRRPGEEWIHRVVQKIRVEKRGDVRATCVFITDELFNVKSRRVAKAAIFR
jgi:hypothetical protein